MPAILPKYIALHYYCSLHIDLTLLHTSIKYQYTTIFIYYTTTKYMPATNMPLKCHIDAIYPNYLMYINGGSMLTYILHMNSLA